MPDDGVLVDPDEYRLHQMMRKIRRVWGRHQAASAAFARGDYVEASRIMEDALRERVADARVVHAYPPPSGHIHMTVGTRQPSPYTVDAPQDTSPFRAPYHSHTSKWTGEKS